MAAYPELMPASYVENGANSATEPFHETGFASISMLLNASALVFLMTPGVGLLYSGLSHHKNALVNMMMSVLAYAVVSIQWVCIGFTLCFDEHAANTFIGAFSMAGMKGVGANTLPSAAPMVPSIVFALFQLQFATVTCAIIFGSVVDRMKILPAIVFIVIWTTIVYDPVAYWTWGKNGWLRNLDCNADAQADKPCFVGAIDFAGGGPVHITSGFSALAYARVLGKRHESHRLSDPSNLANVFIGTGLLWFGWYGFNGASALGSTPRAAMAAFVTTIAASAGALAWMAMDLARGQKVSGVGFCAGSLAGLVGITPGSGFVAPWASIVIGVITACVCNWACLMKRVHGIDDTLDVFGMHGVGGFFGCILAGIFASSDIALLDGTVFGGGGIDGNGYQVAYNILAAVIIAFYSYTLTWIIVTLMNMVVELRVGLEKEITGIDLSELGESIINLHGMMKERESTSNLNKKWGVGSEANADHAAEVTTVEDADRSVAEKTRT
eukprot:gb/GEZN01005520.1/.p1 GENE.gb/GEZN01005520.1/~~gb/GEZN01005520.1/.p1  ORF type:complete len:498 (+),score=53.71 gb/GEZN01005520.1/:57-1550(+)